MYLDDMMVIVDGLDAELSSIIDGMLLLMLTQVFAPNALAHVSSSTCMNVLLIWGASTTEA